MLKANLTLEQSEIVQDICNMQIQSLIRVSMESQVQKYLNSRGIHLDEQTIQNDISEMLRKFDKLKCEPNTLLSLDEVCLSLFKHNLINNDDRYSIETHSKHKSNLWKKLLISEQCQGLLMN